jgi:L-fucose isomerase
MEWTKKYCKEGPDTNTEDIQQTREQKDKNWEFVVKMTIIARDLMIGNPKLAELGFGEKQTATMP